MDNLNGGELVERLIRLKDKWKYQFSPDEVDLLNDACNFIYELVKGE